MVGYYRLSNLGFCLAAGAHIVPREAFAAVEEANDLVAQAEAARAEILRAAEQAYSDEKQRGYEDGLADARVEAIGQMLFENHALDQGLLSIERDLGRLVSDCVRKLISGFEDTAKAEAMVRAALQQMRREKNAELRVPPSLHKHFKTQMVSILTEFPEVDLVDIVEDETLDPEQVILETSIGRVDANIAHRLDNLVTVIRTAHAKTFADALDALQTAGSAVAGLRS